MSGFSSPVPLPRQHSSILYYIYYLLHTDTIYHLHTISILYHILYTTTYSIIISILLLHIVVTLYIVVYTHLWYYI